MKKVVLFSIPIILAISVGVGFLSANRNLRSEWVEGVEKFLHYKNGPGRETKAVHDLQIVEAEKPWNFVPEMSKVSFGEGIYYQTDIFYSDEPGDDDLQEFIPGNSAKDSLVPLPYPPVKAWCLVVKVDGSQGDALPGEDEVSLVVIGLHQDLYHADIIVHETAAGLRDQTADKITALIGCELP
jgi:hypothetical protein